MEEKGFQYTYSAKEHAEIKAIRQKYVPREENKIEKLRQLDRRVTQKATAIAIAVGVIGTLIMGGGMSLCLVGGGKYYFLGVPLGILGLIVLAPANHIFLKVSEKERMKIAPEIMRLTDELLK